MKSEENNPFDEIGGKIFIRQYQRKSYLFDEISKNNINLKKVK